MRSDDHSEYKDSNHYNREPGYDVRNEDEDSDDSEEELGEPSTDDRHSRVNYAYIFSESLEDTTKWILVKELDFSTNDTLEHVFVHITRLNGSEDTYQEITK